MMKPMDLSNAMLIRPNAPNTELQKHDWFEPMKSFEKKVLTVFGLSCAKSYTGCYSPAA